MKKLIIDQAHSDIEFKVKHLMISTVKGHFNIFSGGVSEDGNLTVSMNVNSINTGSLDRDNHLKSADFFNYEEFPTIDFAGKMGEDMLDAAKLTYSSVADMAKGFDIKGIRKEYEEGMTGVLSSLTNALTGKGSPMEIFTALGNAGQGMKEFFEGGFKSSMESAMSTAQLLQNSNNEIIKVVNAAVGAGVNTVTEHEGFNRDAGNTNSPNPLTVMNNDVNNTLNTVRGANQLTTNNAVQPVSHDGKLDIRMTLDAPAHVDTAQLIKALEDPNFRMALIKAIQETQSNYGQSNTGEKK